MHNFSTRNPRLSINSDKYTPTISSLPFSIVDFNHVDYVDHVRGEGVEGRRVGAPIWEEERVGG